MTVAEKATRFLDKFNAPDLEGILATFADDGVFVDQNGKEYTGEPALRAAYAPMFDGSRGKPHYDVEEMFCDDAQQKALVTWTLSISAPDGAVHKVRGLDILRFDGEKLKVKNAFCKAREVLVE